jgi:hypothetical protein
MNEDRHSFYLGLAIIAAIVTIYISGVVKGQAADVAVLTGLIGVLGTFTRRASSPSPTASTETGDVNVTPATKEETPA